ncbi:hypothetical protein ABMA28_008632 [Loxostege sticticalis]|uniref:Uncharacterized protein n=1 Tax=Loxostege sticticalis TaxID=481309 RepID=A0ABD0SEQ4_LOXSC
MRRFDDIFKVFIICVSFLTAFGEEPADDEVSDPDPREEYMVIFKNIPVLFEYLIVTLQDKPEILETNNLKAFDDEGGKINKRDISYEKEDPVNRIADDIFDEVEGLDDPASDGVDDDKENTEGAENEENDVKVTPEEIAEKCLMVEQLLEDYHKEK